MALSSAVVATIQCKRLSWILNASHFFMKQPSIFFCAKTFKYIIDFDLLSRHLSLPRPIPLAANANQAEAAATRILNLQKASRFNSFPGVPKS